MGFRYNAYHIIHLEDNSACVLCYRRDSSKPDCTDGEPSVLFSGDYNKAVALIERVIVDTCDVIVDKYPRRQAGHDAKSSHSITIRRQLNSEKRQD